MVELFVQAVMEKAISTGVVRRQDADRFGRLLLQDINIGRCTHPQIQPLWNLAERWGMC